MKREAQPCEEEEISELMKVLRRKQSALKKAIDRKRNHLDTFKRSIMQESEGVRCLTATDVEISEVKQIIIKYLPNLPFFYVHSLGRSFKLCLQSPNYF